MQHHEEAWIYNGQGEVPPTVRRVKIELAEGISTKIPDEAFYGHQELREVILSSSVQEIGKKAFCTCEKLKSILYQGREKEEVGIPSTVKKIDDRAFWGCKLLVRLGLNEGLERIGRYAFYHCKSLTRMEIPSTVNVIDDHAFQDCRRLARLGLNEGLKRIGQAAFHRCESLTEVEIPSSVNVIDDQAFEYCERLARLTLNENLKRIGKRAFKCCHSTEVHIPSTVKVIDDSAFWGCTSLARLGLNEGLEEIGVEAFRLCKSLTEVNLPSTVKVIDDGALSQCKLLKSLVLNEGLDRIGRFAFNGCDSLSHVRIPQNVDSIATNAFIKCISLISIELPEEWSFNIDLSGCQSLVSLAGQMPTFYHDVRSEQSFQRSKFGILVDSEADLIRRLNHRFDNSPLNKLCYYQSYQSLDDAMARLRSLMDENPLAATMKVDEFGMIPLHILSLSQAPNLDMLLAVMDAGKPGHMVCVRDSFGSTPMDYLCLNRMPNSNEVIRRLVQTRWYQVLGLDEFWKFDMLQAIDEALGGDCDFRGSKIGGVVRKYERKEIISLLELCLWKVKIDEATPKKVKIGEATSKKEQILADRQRCRVMSGAAVVIPHVLHFLDN